MSLVHFREAKLISPSKNLFELINDYGEAIGCSSNCRGSKVALTIALRSLIPDTKLYVIDLESDSVQWIDFTSGMTNIGEDNNFFQ